MYARLGRMKELEALLKSVEGRAFPAPRRRKSPAPGRASGICRTARRFPFAAGRLPCTGSRSLSIQRTPERLDSRMRIDAEGFLTPASCGVFAKARPQLPDGLSRERRSICRAFRRALENWTLRGHRAAGRRSLPAPGPHIWEYVWVTREALEAETSGYFLIPSGKLPQGWRAVEAEEGETVWGKGERPRQRSGPSRGRATRPHQEADSVPPTMSDCKGMAVPRVHLMLVSLNINDEPVGYSPPVGPAVRFSVRYNQREALQPSNFTYSNFGPKWTFDWLSYITDNPFSPAADVTYYIMGGGTRRSLDLSPPAPPIPPIPGPLRHLRVSAIRPD